MVPEFKCDALNMQGFSYSTSPGCVRAAAATFPVLPIRLVRCTGGVGAAACGFGHIIT